MTSRYAGLPVFPGRSRYFAGMIIDAAGSGMYLPFSLLYFHYVTGLPITVVGGGMTLAALCGLAGNPAAGALADRAGARTVVVAGYLLRAGGLGSYLWVRNYPQMVIAAAAVALGDRSFPPAVQSLISEVASGVRRERLIALHRSARNGGLGLGGLAAAVLLGAAGREAYYFVVVTDAVSFLVAAGLLASVPFPREHGASPRHASAGGGYRAVLRDSAFMTLSAANVPVALCYTALSALLPIYVVESLHASPAIAGLLFALSTVQVTVAQVPVSRWQERTRRNRAAALGAAVFAASCLGFAMLYWLPGRSLIAAGLVVATLIYTSGELLHCTAANALAANSAPAALRGRYLAVYQLSWSLSAVAGPALFTAVLAFSPPVIWIALAAGAGAAAVVFLSLEHRFPAAAVRPATTADPAPPPRDGRGEREKSTARMSVATRLSDMRDQRAERQPGEL